MRRILSPLAIVLGLLASALSYSRLPDILPTHWDASGHVNGTSPKLWALVMLPALAASTWALMRLFPRVDPRTANYAKFQDSYDLVVTLVVVTLIAIHLATIASALGVAVSVAKVATACIGALFVAIGNFLPRARPNFFFGIRTPWTLSSDTVWTRTHRIGGYAMVGNGLILLVAAILGGPFALVTSVILVVATALALTIYSYVLWHREGASG